MFILLHSDELAAQLPGQGPVRRDRLRQQRHLLHVVSRRRRPRPPPGIHHVVRDDVFQRADFVVCQELSGVQGAEPLLERRELFVRDGLHQPVLSLLHLPQQCLVLRLGLLSLLLLHPGFELCRARFDAKMLVVEHPKLLRLRPLYIPTSDRYQKSLQNPRLRPSLELPNPDNPPQTAAAEQTS
eukprot:COSAG04_NODE_715_length_10861_cov_4.115406_4_plen_184_part_00